MEKDTFGVTLSDNEVKVFCAASDVMKENDEIKTSVLRSHELVCDMKPATFHRALKSLIDKNFISHFTGTKARLYTISDWKQV
jgi:hypothetical protein